MDELIRGSFNKNVVLYCASTNDVDVFRFGCVVCVFAFLVILTLDFLLGFLSLFRVVEFLIAQ
ncbi:hypothetical protein MAH4_24680 [Sessilibacter sp. MAH4]